MHIPTLFRIWYSTTYTILFFILLLLLAVSPGEQIYQTIRLQTPRIREFQKIIVLGGTYVLTIIVVLLVYSTRLYTNRSVLLAIPKPYVPIEDGEVGKGVRRMIVKALRKSAIIAWDTKPRDVRGEAIAVEESEKREGIAERIHKWRKHAHPTTIVPIFPQSPPWGIVSHPGWASPACPDLPNLQYANVIAELPNLIEAKAVSLAPPDSAVEDHILAAHNTPVLPDAQVVNFLQRPRAMGLRDYLGRLSSFGLLNPPSLGAEFLSLYEHARFSTRSLTEKEFRDIMGIFAEILNSMTDLDPGVIEEAHAEPLDTDADTRSLAPSTYSRSSSPSGHPYATPMVDKRSEFSFNVSTGSPQTVRTARSRIGNTGSGAYTVPRTLSYHSLASGEGSVRISRERRSPSTILPNSSSSSSRSRGSVIRLRDSPAEGESSYQYHFEDG